MKEPSSSFWLSFGNGVLKYRWLVLAATVILSAAALPGLFNLDISVSIEDFFLEDDPVLKNQKKFQQTFHGNDFVGVLVESNDVFSRKSLETIKLVGDRLMKEVPLAKNTTSLAKFKDYFKRGRKLRFKEERLISTDREIAAFKKYWTGDESLVKGILFSTDCRQAWVQLTVLPYPERDKWPGKMDPLSAVGKSAYDTVSSIKTDNIRLTATGVPVYAYRKQTEMTEDLARVLAFGAVAAFFLALILLQSIQGVLGTMLIIAFSDIIIFGVQGWLGISMDSAFIGVPVMLAMGVSIGYTVHISRFFSLHYNKSGDRRASIIFALQKSGKPILFTAFTTIVALLSFLLVEIKPIQWVGLTSAFSILSVLILSIFFFPVIISFGKKRNSTRKPVKKYDFIQPVLRHFSYQVGRKPGLIIIIFLLITTGAFFGISQLKVDFNAEKLTGTKLQHMKDQIRIGKSKIATNDTMDLVLTFPEKSLKKQEYLKNIEILQRKINALPLVKKTSSLTGPIGTLNYFIKYKNKEYKRVPDKKEDFNLILSVLEQYAPDILKTWTAKDYSTARVFIELSQFSSLQIETNIKSINEYVTEIFPPGTDHYFSGATYQMAAMNQYITKGLVRSILTALVMITLLMMLVFRSIRLGLVAMIPNVFPVLVAGGVMGFLNIPLEFVTMTVAPMIMGLAVDDTIHLLSHLKDDMEQSDDFGLSVTRTFATVGSAITETTIILCVTFLLFSVSKVNNFVNMGLISCAGIFAAYLADIFVTPILIKKLKYGHTKNKDIDYSTDPAHDTFSA